MMQKLKLEWGNRQHINLVRHHDMRLRGLMPVVLRTSVDYCFAKQSTDRHGTWYFERTGSRVTKNMHCIVLCPCCNHEAELVNSLHISAPEWLNCNNCDAEFEFRKVKIDYYPWHRYEVYLVQES